MANYNKSPLRNYVWTLKCNEQDIKNGYLEFLDTSRIKYCVWSLESGGKTDYLHWQGYTEFNKPTTMNQLKEIFERQDIHIEPRMGTAKQAIDYCSKKDETHLDGPWSFGEPAKQGERNDWKAALDFIKETPDLRSVADEIPRYFFQYGRAVEKAIALYSKPRNFKPEVWLVYGPTGTGKSAYCEEEAGPDAYWKPCGQWWDNFNGRDNVIIDDFKGEGMTLSELLRVLDRYPHQVPVKGAYVQFAPRKIFLSCNWLPEDWYPAGEYLAPLYRRIDHYVLIMKDTQIVFHDYPRFKAHIDALGGQWMVVGVNE